MANVFPEVLPNVTSMPTEGWFCQTSGKARRRITANTSASDSEGIYDVRGVPGFTHNTSAVVSVTADYTRYRESRLFVPTNVWSVGHLEFPVGMLTDSLEPDNAEERFDRAIEKCVGKIALFPENCTGHIDEPTRSIGEIRTLVAPKSRLETLTYIDEMGGWRVPSGGNDRDAAEDAPDLDSLFPEVRVSVLPTDMIKDATLNLGVAPSSLFIDESTIRFKIIEAAQGSIGYLADKHRLYEAIAGGGDAAAIAAADNARQWDGCLVFTWDADKRLYRSKELTVVLADVQGVRRDNGNDVAGTHYDGGVGNPAKLIVTFPSVETTPARDGYCWFAGSNNEDVLGFIRRNNGASVAKNMQVHVVGVPQQGPFYWVGQPAFRIPVGQKYAYPAPDILGEFAQSADTQYSFYDKFISFTPLGLLRYKFKQQTANALPHADADQTRVRNSQLGQPVMNFAARSQEINGGLFYPRLGGLEKVLSDKQRYIDFTPAPATPYVGVGGGAGIAANQIVTAGIPNVMYNFQKLSVRRTAINQYIDHNVIGEPLGLVQQLAALQDQLLDTKNTIDEEYVNGDEARLGILRDDVRRITSEIVELQEERDDALRMQFVVNAYTALDYVPPFIYKPDSTTVSDVSMFKIHRLGDEARFAGSTSFVFAKGGGDVFRDAADGSVKRAYTVADVPNIFSHQFVRLPVTPLFFECNTTLPLELHRATMEAGNCFTLKNSRAIIDVTSVDDEKVNCAFDFTDTLSDERGRHTDGTPGARFFAGAYSFMLERDADGSSNLVSEYVGLANPRIGFASAQALRTHFGDGFEVSNKFAIPKGDIEIDEEKDPGGTNVVTNMRLKYTMFATAKPVQGLVFIGAAVAGRQQMVIVQNPNTRAIIQYEPAGANGIDETANNGGANDTSFALVNLGRPKYVSAADGFLADVPSTVFTGIADGAGWDMYVLSSDFVEATDIFDQGPFVEDVAESQHRGAVFQSIKRISQHVCGPILNPNSRIGAVAPLNYDSRHLPPEMRDFRLRFSDIDWSRLQATQTTLNEIQLYQFNDGLQKVATQTNILYLPQFRETKHVVSGNQFEVEVFSELGAPSYFCFFCRFPGTDILQQPQIKSLSIFNATTKKKSNVVTELDISQLYHLTQRNVHPAAQYDRSAFSRRQTVLLKTEDIGLMGLTHDEYQKPKRVTYRFSGRTSDPGNLYVVVVYNNRGLAVDGRRLQVVTLNQ